MWRWCIVLFLENVVILRSPGVSFISIVKGRIDFLWEEKLCPGTEHEPQVCEDGAHLDLYIMLCLMSVGGLIFFPFVLPLLFPLNPNHDLFRLIQWLTYCLASVTHLPGTPRHWNAERIQGPYLWRVTDHIITEFDWWFESAVINIDEKVTNSEDIRHFRRRDDMWAGS